MGWIAYRIFREEGRPVFFRQMRIGQGGRSFLFWKFRTMTPEGRVTRLGGYLRSTALDELPQLFHILKGQMSFVGPRPLIPEELRQLDGIPGSRRRLGVRPGLTGLAQLKGTKVPDPAERIRWDVAYIDRMSPMLDLRILAESIWVTARKGWEKP